MFDTLRYKLFGKRLRMQWYVACVDEALENTSPFCVFHNDDHPNFECVIIRDTRLLSAVFPIEKMDYRGNFDGLHIIAYRRDSWARILTASSLSALYFEITGNKVYGY